MDYVPHTPEEQIQMMKAIGIEGLEALFRRYSGKIPAEETPRYPPAALGAGDLGAHDTAGRP